MMVVFKRGGKPQINWSNTLRQREQDRGNRGQPRPSNRHRATSASPNESTLAEAALAQRHIAAVPNG